MRSSFMCLGIAIALFATACDKREKVTAPLLPIPECKSDQAYDAAAFERMVRAMDRSGDLAAVAKRFVQHRKTLEALLTKRDPALLPRLKKVMDAQFSEARLRERAACVFTDMSSQGKGIEKLDAWSRSPEMQAINTAIWSRTPAPSKEENVKMTPARMELLRKIAAAMTLQQVEVNNEKAGRTGVPALVAVFGPTPIPNAVPAPEAAPVPTPTPAAAPATTPASTLPSTTAAPVASAPAATTPVASAPVASAPTATTPVASAPVASAPVASAPAATTPVASAPASTATATSSTPVSITPPITAPANVSPSSPPPGSIAVPDVDEIVEGWLIPALAKIPDDDLAEYLEFAGSSFGSDYYVALSRAYDFQVGDWYAQMVELFTDNIPPASLGAGDPGRDALLADARRSLHDVATPAAAADAMAKLLQADRLDPRNPEIQTLLGEAAMKTAPYMPLAPGQLRVVIQTPNYEQAEVYLSKAIELAPGNADANMLLGRLRYLQGRDDEAGKLYAHAIELGPEHPSKDLYLGDLAYVRNDYGKATNYYKTAISKPERLAYTHVTALAHLLMSLRKGLQLGEYPRVAEAYLAKYPQAWNFRLDYADFLLTLDTPADKIFAVADPIPDNWFPARKIPIISVALMRKAGERADRNGEATAESMQLIRRAIGMNPDAVTLAEAMCQAGTEGKLMWTVFDQSKDQKRLATALVLCGLRWKRNHMVKDMTKRADIPQLDLPRAEMGGDTPLCYAAATKNIAGFAALGEARVSPARKCRDGNTVAERLLRMSYSRDQNVVQMQIMMEKFYKKAR
jgi:tetratricopeptide (TPR) repeat protein